MPINAFLKEFISKILPRFRVIALHLVVYSLPTVTVQKYVYSFCYLIAQLMLFLPNQKCIFKLFHFLIKKLYWT